MESLTSAPAPHVFAATPGHLIRLLYQRHNSIWHATVGDSITPIQFAILNVVYTDGPSPQHEISVRVRTDTSTMAQAAASLERKNLIKRSVNPADKRERRIALTRTGRREYAQLLPKADEVQRVLFEVLDPDDHPGALALLQNLAGLPPACEGRTDRH
ncbi:winged helix-turn-helix transcriptional regulator [Nocardia abscessus]|jgi:DNA-binding MarR family transcriptional regulator|uniref:MarR family winged helix-turn-helix transcriptional regulator n=1 Tax=Nocardia TaxID=1817 RepID=UPI0015EE6CAE|nr:MULTISPECIES: MarR family winged helix-turn-helix transcriptional regulator [Nocardia]MBF6219011.1 winged helix-turn-helix transcriptional regulator [Nocardia abscessus]MBF6472870.1 winged helix-turn-helix transcriptional regulator [Nocardia abscessus]